MAKLLIIPGTKMLLCGSILTIVVGVIALITALNVISTDPSASTLKFVIVVSRHGARVPLFTFPTDPYQGPEYWPEGKGALTKKGKQQMYKMGQSLRRRYQSILFKQGYRSTDLMARSTPRSRTLMSGAVLLAGMFPPEGINIWHPNINWQPIPIFTNDLDKTWIISNETSCAKFTAEKHRVEEEHINDYFKKNRDFFHYLEQHTGATISTIFDYNNVWDPIATYNNHGLTLPSWTKPIFPEKMYEVAAYVYKMAVVGAPVMNKLFSGPLIKDFDSWISRKMRDEVGEKMLLLAAHDLTVIGLMSAVGFEEIAFVEPAATLLIELHVSPQHQHEVRMFYYKSSDEMEPQSLNMPNCPDPCPASTFIKVLQQMEIEGEWEVACKL